jgi:predicted metalloprotease
MRIQGMRRSGNVEDRRGMSGGGKLAIGGGLGGLIIAVIFLLLGGDSGQILESIQQAGASATAGVSQPLTEKDKEMGDFVSVILADTEDVWSTIFRESGRTYQAPRLVLFSDATSSACGYASAASGPFYCPGDEKVYLDLGFFEDMQKKLGATGDFALAYVIAHRIMSQQGRLSEREFNQQMVRLELQADFLSGVWAHFAQRTRDFIEAGDIEEGMNAASAVGDDRIMKKTQGYVVPDAFTHGTSEQRVRWFRKGFETGDMAQGDTFQAKGL